MTDSQIRRSRLHEPTAVISLTRAINLQCTKQICLDCAQERTPCSRQCKGGWSSWSRQPPEWRVRICVLQWTLCRFEKTEVRFWKEKTGLEWLKESHHNFEREPDAPSQPWLFRQSQSLLLGAVSLRVQGLHGNCRVWSGKSLLKKKSKIKHV